MDIIIILRITAVLNVIMFSQIVYIVVLVYACNVNLAIIYPQGHVPGVLAKVVRFVISLILLNVLLVILDIINLGLSVSCVLPVCLNAKNVVSLQLVLNVPLVFT